ncbi:hypothetical protein [Intestinimonas butyriciproducens]|uniref:hypothetical protein n=1 Tax=Intestinimonas butyriciproducens TaxID=1297617 RepID=UPI00051C108D|nr:hypothetical protein [Intestinimonas butyriciproducens]
MAKRVYIGVGGKARKVKKIYIGVAGVARKVKKAYIGVGGVARIFWSGGQIESYGEVTALSVGRQEPAGNAIGGYALFAGGRSASSTYRNTIDAYNSSLTRSTPVTLSGVRANLCTCKAGSYALFGGGHSSNSAYATTVDAFNSTLTRTTATACGERCVWPACAALGTAGLFAQSSGTSNGASYNKVYLYNSSLTQSTGTLSRDRSWLAGGAIGSYALFAGGYYNPSDDDKDPTYYNTVDAFNSSLTRSLATGLSAARGEMFPVNAGDFLLFAGGSNASGVRNTVDAYNSSLTRTTATSLPTASYVGAMSGVTLEGKALIETKDTMLIYDESLTQTILETFDSAYGTRSDAAAAVVGSYGLFAGGYGKMGGLSSNTRLDLVRAYTI